MRIWFNGAPFEATTPHADIAAEADAGPRLILYLWSEDAPEIFIAPAGTIYAGWVIGKSTEEKS